MQPASVKRYLSLFISTPLVGVAAFALFAQAAGACDTPVYRYAMYNWGTSPQMVFCFHAGPLEGKDAEIAAKLDGLAQSEPRPNLVYRAIDVEDEETLKRIDPDVRQFWETHGEKKTPWWLVVSAWGAVLQCGDWDLQSAADLADSALRRRVAELLHDGDATVFLFLEGNDPKENEEAVKAAQKVIRDVESNQIQTPENMTIVELGGTEGTPQGKEETVKIGLVRVSLDDAKEKGLIEQLLMVEPGLKEDRGAPMLFPIYGRGRAMRPFIGKGINERNLTDAVLFLLGDCSCMAKEQNPGVDLCFAWDWESTADKWALQEEAGAAAGQGSSGALVYQEYSLDDLSDGKEAQTGPSGNPPSSNTEMQENGAVKKVAATQSDLPAPARAAETSEDPPSDQGMGRRQIWTVSVVLGVLAVGVFLTGAVFLRR